MRRARCQLCLAFLLGLYVGRCSLKLETKQRGETKTRYSDCFELEVVEKMASGQYTGDLGKEYWAWQSNNIDIGGRITAALFQNYSQPGYTVLDVGCGSGTVIQNVPARERWCVEVNPLARAVAAKSVGATDRVFASIDELPDQRFDLIISNHALEHVSCPLLFVRKLQKKLKSGGKVVFATPGLQDELTYQMSLKYGDQGYDEQGDNNHHLYAWSSQQLANLFKIAGYEVLEARTRLYSRTPEADEAWQLGGERAFWPIAERQNRHPQTMVVARHPQL